MNAVKCEMDVLPWFEPQETCQQMWCQVKEIFLDGYRKLVCAYIIYIKTLKQYN